MATRPDLSSAKGVTDTINTMGSQVKQLAKLVAGQIDRNDRNNLMKGFEDLENILYDYISLLKISSTRGGARKRDYSCYSLSKHLDELKLIKPKIDDLIRLMDSVKFPNNVSTEIEKFKEWMDSLRKEIIKVETDKMADLKAKGCDSSTGTTAAPPTCTCGIKGKSRIVGGTEATVGPSFVSLKRFCFNNARLSLIYFNSSAWEMAMDCCS